MKTSNQMMSELREVSRNHGRTFKKVNSYVNGVQAFSLFDRTTGVEIGCGINSLSGWYDAHIFNDAIVNCAEEHFL